MATGDDILAQLRDLLEQYLALGDQTPVADQAQQLLQAIDTSGGPAVAPDQGAGLGTGEGLGPTTPPENQMLGGDLMAPQEGEPPANPKAKTFGDANKSALDRLKKRNKSAKAA